MSFGNPGDFQWVDVGGIASVLVVADSNQGKADISLPTVGSWFSKNWYVVFIIALFLVVCIASMILSLLRWKMRRRHRTHREVKGKSDMIGDLRRVASSFSLASSFARENDDEIDENNHNNHNNNNHNNNNNNHNNNKEKEHSQGKVSRTQSLRSVRSASSTDSHKNNNNNYNSNKNNYNNNKNNNNYNNNYYNNEKAVSAGHGGSASPQRYRSRSGDKAGGRSR